MFNIHEVELEWAGRPLKIQTGKIARQAHGAVVVSYGDTMVLATVVAEKLPKPGVDFFPLSVHYQEKAYAAGKIPGGFFKREGRPSEKETLTSRLIDRPIRPLFPSHYTCETQVLITVLSHDMENDPDIPSMIATSAALTLSGVPFLGPIGGARVALIENEFVINPSVEEVKNSDLDLVVAGTRSAVLMVESEAKELTEEIMLEAVVAGQESFEPVIDSIIALAELAAKEPRELVKDDKEALVKRLKDIALPGLRDAYKIVGKSERQDALDQARKAAITEIGGDEELDENTIRKALKSVESEIVRSAILETGKRIDGRDLTTVRPIEAEVGILPRSHGSALFTRGETQALVVATLGTGEDEQFVDALEGTYKEPFMLHYNFPPYSVGETGRVGATGRREIGHGKLAWRAVKPMLPDQESFPYTLRVVSEITESNGSSSMATVCGTSLSLMDAGVPLERPIAGIAMGLIKEGDDFAVLSDILGDEDHLGDMDFKVAGTELGVTSLQMDIKITGITNEIMKVALNQARDGRLHILGEMARAINTAREELGEHAPKISQIKIPVDKIRDVIGTGGKVIREIVEKTSAKINVSDEGLVKIASSSADAIEAAVSWITSLTSEPVVGEVYEGKVVKIMDFGAFVNFFGNRDGLVHISQLAPERINSPHDIVNEGDMVKVKMIGIDDRGKVRLSMKVVNQETGEVINGGDDDHERRPPRRDRDNRGGRGRRDDNR